MPKLRSDDLKTLVEICEYQSSKNQLNESTRNLVPVTRAYCRIEPVSADTFIKSGAVGSALVARLIFRPDVPIRADQIIRVINGGIYDVRGVLPIPHENKQAALCSVGGL